MGSRRETGVEGARLPSPSRRAVVAGSSAAMFGAAPGALAPPDEGSAQCRRWLAVDAEIERLQARWAALESWLARDHAWLSLTPAAQKALPWAQEFHEVDSRLDGLYAQRRTLLAQLPASGVAALGSVVDRLAVAERLVWPDEHPEAHALIAGSRQDLILMARETHAR